MKPKNRFVRIATISFLLSQPVLRAQGADPVPSEAERAAMAQEVEQLSQRSAELKSRSAEAVQRTKERHSQITIAIAERQAAEQAKTRDTATKWVAALQLRDAEKASRVIDLVSSHLGAVRDWHNSHPGDAVPELDAATGKKLSSLERQFIADSAMPRQPHKVLMDGLRRELSPEQVELILDCYTEGKVAFTLKGYKAIVPDLTAQEEAHILGLLKRAREEAIDYKGSKLISQVFEGYKTQCEQYLDAQGRNWKQLYKAYTDAVKQRKAAEKAGH